VRALAHLFAAWLSSRYDRGAWLRPGSCWTRPGNRSSMTVIAEEIFAVLPARHGLIARSLRYHRRFRCPVCGQGGDATREPTSAVAYHRIAMAGGYSGESSSDGLRPDELMVVRWWLTHTHHRCPTAPVQPWSALPQWASPTRSMAAVEPQGRGSWTASLTPTGLPMLWWQVVAPVAHVVWVGDRLGIGEERLVDVVEQTMQQRGAGWLRDRDLLLDAVDALTPLHDWHAQLDPSGRVTVWMPGSVAQQEQARAEGLDPDTTRTPLCTLDGLPADWIAAAGSQRRMLLAMTPPGTDEVIIDPGLSRHWATMATHPGDIGPFIGDPPDPAPPRPRTPTGGIIAAGTVPDRDRRLIAPRRRARAAGHTVPLIDVQPLWETALARAEDLVGAHYPDDGPAGPTRGDTATVIALVLAAASRANDCTPEQVTPAEVAMRLVYPYSDVAGWLAMMLQPTTAADHLHQAETESFHRHDVGGRYRSTAPLRDRSTALAVLGRRWLIDRGGLHAGDHAVLLPDAETDTTARRVRVRGLSPLTWPQPPVQETRIVPCVDIDHEHGHRGRFETVDGFDLLLADGSCARAVVQAAYSAGCDLWLRRNDLAGGINAEHVRRLLRTRSAHHTIVDVRQVLDTVIAADDGTLASAMTAGIVTLQALAPHHVIPGPLIS
jgi:hypothetical protein